jgi:hypothetical protein
MGRNSVDATNAFLIRSARADGRLFRLLLTVFVPFFRCVVIVAFFVAVVFFDVTAGFAFWLVLEEGADEASFWLSVES